MFLFFAVYVLCLLRSLSSRLMFLITWAFTADDDSKYKKGSKMKSTIDFDFIFGYILTEINALVSHFYAYSRG